MKTNKIYNEHCLETHKLKTPVHGNIYEEEGEFSTYCGITHECSESFFEADAIVGAQDKCTCKACAKAYEAACRAADEPEQVYVNLERLKKDAK